MPTESYKKHSELELHPFLFIENMFLRKRLSLFQIFIPNLIVYDFFIEFLQKPNESLLSKLPKTPRKSEKC